MKCEAVNPYLVKKYNRPVPRYTSYPTVPYWNTTPDIHAWLSEFSQSFESQNHIKGISIYIHLPFCESLCTYCGCNKKITTNHNVEEEYITALEQEWKQYRRLMTQTPIIREIHLGGGTPTFFSPKNLRKIIAFIKNDSIIHPHHEFSIEGHPNNTTLLHLKTLHQLGFRRISFGVQDNDPIVQKVINRIQPWNNVAEATDNARKVGFTSVNYDLIYGLPLQTIEGMEETFKLVLSQRPDRIAFYSYAHVPWTSKSQRLFNEEHLPDADKKLALYLKGKQILLENGYADIGMDHFALPNDTLYQAWTENKLHRNFMGYTTSNTPILIGLGVSAISQTNKAYAQNTKTLHDYYNLIKNQTIPTQKTYQLTPVDVSLKKHIIDIACNGYTKFQTNNLELLQQYVFPQLQELQQDGLINYDNENLKVTNQGRYFIRNICSAFDLYLNNLQDNTTKYSKSV